MGSQLFIGIVIDPGLQLFKLLVLKPGAEPEAVRVLGLGHCPVLISGYEPVWLQLPFILKKHGKPAGFVSHLHRKFLFSKLHSRSLCPRKKRLDQKPFLYHMGPQESSRIAALRIYDLLDPCPVHLII